MSDVNIKDAVNFQRYYRLLRLVKPTENESSITNAIAAVYFGGNFSYCEKLYSYIVANTPEHSVDTGDLSEHAKKCVAEIDKADADNKKTLETIKTDTQKKAAEVKASKAALEKFTSGEKKLKDSLVKAGKKVKWQKFKDKLKEFGTCALYIGIAVLALGSGLAASLVGFGLETIGTFVASLGTTTAISLGGMAYLFVFNKEKRAARKKKRQEKAAAEGKAFKDAQDKFNENAKQKANAAGDFNTKKAELAGLMEKQVKVGADIQQKTRQNALKKQQYADVQSDNVAKNIQDRIKLLDSTMKITAERCGWPNAYKTQLDEWIKFAGASMYYRYYTENLTLNNCADVFDNICNNVRNMIESTSSPSVSGIQSFDDENMKSLTGGEDKGVTRKDITSFVLGIKPKEDVAEDDAERTIE